MREPEYGYAGKGVTMITMTEDRMSELLSKASEYGADQELEACCEWLFSNDYDVAPVVLRAARRPKPPSLKAQALTSLRRIQDNEATYLDAEHIRRALEQLSDHK